MSTLQATPTSAILFALAITRPTLRKAVLKSAGRLAEKVDRLIEREIRKYRLVDCGGLLRPSNRAGFQLVLYAQRFAPATISKLQLLIMKQLSRREPTSQHALKVFYHDDVGIVWKGQSLVPDGNARLFCAIATDEILYGRLGVWNHPLILFGTSPHEAAAHLEKWSHADS